MRDEIKGGTKVRVPDRKERERERQREKENILCERKDKICADSFLARGPEH